MENKADKETLYVFKGKKLYAKLEQENYYLFRNDTFVLYNEALNEIKDILPEGIDLKIMMNSFNIKSPLELLSFLKNPIGDFSFSKNKNKDNFEKILLSDLVSIKKFPNILDSTLEIDSQMLKPNEFTNLSEKNQKLSLSGYQHKLQVSIIDNIIKENYADFILKPNNPELPKISINEHLHTSFMQEFGFEIPLNAIVYDEKQREYHYLIKRFEIDKNGKKLPQISLNALMKSEQKYEGTIERISAFLKDKLEEREKILFLKYIYANALLYNNDLHKKNISFLFKENKLILSPPYDVINIYAIKGLSNTQCCLHINGKLNHIKINHFEKSSEKLGLNFAEIQNELKQVLEIYLENYPIYLQKLKNIPNFKGIKEFENKLLESYNKIFKHSKLTGELMSENLSYVNVFSAINNDQNFHNEIKESKKQEKSSSLEETISRFDEATQKQNLRASKPKPNSQEQEYIEENNENLKNSSNQNSNKKLNKRR